MGDIDEGQGDQNKRDHTAIDMEDQNSQLATSIKGKFEILPRLSSNCCIYRVPDSLRKINEDAYTPTVVSIGPFHRGKESLRAIEEQKVRYLKNLVQRGNKNLEDYIKAIKEWEEVARQYYGETIELSSDKFVEMVLVDGCFIIELFLQFCDPSLRDENDRIFSKPCIFDDINRDIELLENQLPFFLLEGLYNLVFDSSQVENHQSFRHLTSKVIFEDDKSPEIIVREGLVNHFLDFTRTLMVSSTVEPPLDNFKYELPATATELHQAGVKFKASPNFLEFANGLLQLPPLDFYGHSESLFRNLTAFEQCHYSSDTQVVAFISFMDSLISTPKDVDLLIHSGIIVNRLGGNDEVSSLFNNIKKHMRLNVQKSHFFQISRDLNAHCKSRRHRWKATLKRDYFSSPWSIISVIAAVLILILTFIQTWNSF